MRMGTRSKGTLELGRGSILASAKGGEVGFTITGGEWRDVTPTGDRWAHYRWTGRFRLQGRTLQIGFMCGTGLAGIPDARDILRSAFRDAESVAWDSFEGFCDEYGYDSDSRNALRIYRACERMNGRLDRFFGSAREDWEEASNRWAEVNE